MHSVKEKLRSFISRELYGIAERANYPLNPAVGLDCFFAAFDKNPVSVSHDRKHKVATFYTRWTIKRQPDILSAEISYDEILRGESYFASGTMGSLLDSLSLVHDGLINDGSLNRRRYTKWDGFRESNLGRLQEKMKKHLLLYFERYQENIFVDFDGSVPALEEPQLFDRVMKDYPIDVLKNAIFVDECYRRRVIPCVEEIINERLDDGWSFAVSPNGKEVANGYGPYHPSEAVMIDYFRGKYLGALVDLKGWPMEEKGRQRLLELASKGVNGMPNVS